MALLRYTLVFGTQTTQTALSNGTGKVQERLARWLLMCLDRIDGDEVVLTHQFLSTMLGVRRPGVTDALHILEGEKLISAKRGVIKVRDRQGLAALAGKSYGTAEAEYIRLIGPFRP